jgi:carboxylate-amine ligase
MQAVPARTIIRRMVERCDPFAERLGCLKELHYIDEILEQGTGSQRQRKVFEQTGDLHQVVRFLVEQAQPAGV